MARTIRLRNLVVLVALSCGIGADRGTGVGAAEPAGDRPPGKRPNIVLILADDMGFSDLGCYGSEIATPNLDALAANGLRFTQFYNNAKCNTTRASVLTGLYPRRRDLLSPSMVTIGEALREAGYRTSLSGKWHLGAKAPHRPIDRGFDEFYGLLDGACNYFNPARPDPDYKGGGVRTWAHNDTPITEFPDGFYTTDAISDHAARTIRAFASEPERKPFLVHVCYNAPHYPLHARPEDIARYRGKYMMGWDELRLRRHRRQVELGLIDPSWPLPPRDREVRAWDVEPNKEWQDLRMAVYAAQVDSLDRGIGRVLQALRETGTEDNTIVLFLSDNGGCAELPGGEDPSRIPGPEESYVTCGPGWAYAQNTPFRRFKTWVHEGGIATPLIVRWPGVVAPNTINRQVGHIIDLLPTFLDLAGHSYPGTFQGHPIQPVEGISLLPLFQGRSRPDHETLYWEWAGNRAIRQGRWKLAWDKTVRRWELYDVEADRTEINDLARDEPDRVRRMSAAWTAWADRTGVKASRAD
jgi:arylsulfatase A-like enzyme